LLSLSFAEERVDVLFLTNPGAYSILNQYEQPLSNEEKRLFSSPVPLIILNREELLGDQITTSLKGSFHNTVWHVLKDEDGRFKGKPDSAGRAELKGCVLLNDTITILKAQSVAYGTGPSALQKSGLFTANERLVRLFRYRNAYCLASVSGPIKIRWSALTPASAWKATHARQVDISADTLDAASCSAVRAVCEAANKSYDAFFSHFNTLTSQDKSAPRWKTVCTSSEIKCTLSGAPSVGDALYESTRSLVRTMENALIGKPIRMTFSTNEIMVAPKGGAQ